MSNEIENIFKKKFEHFESAPRAGMFDAILAKRAKKKRFIIWMWSAAGISLLGIIGTWALLSSSNSNTDLNKSPIEVVETATPKIDLKSILEKENSEETVSEITTPVTNEIVTLIEDKTTESESIKSPNTKSNTPTQITETRIKTPTKPVDNGNNDSKIVNQELANLFQKIASDSKDLDPNKARVITKNGEMESDILPKENEKVDKIIAQEIKDPVKSVVKQAEDKPTLEKPDSSSTADKDKSTNPGRKLNKYSGFTIQVTSGMGYGSRLLSGDADYVNLRNQAENSQLSYMTDIAIGYQFAQKWNIQTGINLVKRNENFSYQTPDIQNIGTRSEERYETIIHPVLGEITRKYTVEVADTITTMGSNLTDNNGYTMISIPIQLERILWSKDKWNLLAQVGLLTSISSKAKGTTILSENTAQDLSNLPLKSIGVRTINLGVGITYNATDRLQLVAYPQARMGINSGVNSDAFKQRDLGIYSQFGLRVRL